MTARVPPPVSPALQPRLRNEGGLPSGRPQIPSTYRNTVGDPRSLQPAPSTTATTSQPQLPPRPTPGGGGGLGSANSSSSHLASRPLPTVGSGNSPKGPRAASPPATSPQQRTNGASGGGTGAGGGYGQPAYSPARIRRSSSWKDIKEVAMMAAEQSAAAHGGTGGASGPHGSWRGGSAGATAAAQAGATLRRTSFSNAPGLAATSTTTPSTTASTTTTGSVPPLNAMRAKPPRPARTAPNSPSSFDGTLPPRDAPLTVSAPGLQNRKPPPQPPIRAARPALDATIPHGGTTTGGSIVSFSPSNYGAPAVAHSTQSSSFSPSNAGGSGSSSPGTTARRRSADFSSLKNQIALSLEERDTNNASRESKEKEARAELLREVREHGGASTGGGGGGAINNNYRATAKLQDFGKNLLGRAKKLKGSRVGGKDAVGAGGDDDDEFEDAKSNAGTPMGSQENMRSIFGPADVAAATAGSATKLEPSPRPISVFPGRGDQSVLTASGGASRPISYFPRGGVGAGSAVVPPVANTSAVGGATLGAGMGSIGSGSVSTIPSPNSSPASFSPAPSNPNESPHDRRSKIANELLETERSYISALCTLVDVYQAPLLAFAKETISEMADIAMQVTQIFPAVLQLIPFNRELLKRLETVMSEWHENSTIGQIFVEMAPFLKMYKDYENSYSQTLDNYTEMLKDPAFRVLVDQLDSDPRVQSSRLESIIIMPIQRIPRYKLLLEDLLKRTPDAHPDCNLLKESLKKVDEVAVFLDSNLKEHEQRQKVVELTVNFNASTLLQPHRKWLREGEVGLRDPNLGNRVKKLHILLFNDILVPTVLSKLGVGGDNRRDVLNRPENQWPLELMWLSEPDLSIGTEKDNKGKNLQLELAGPGTNYSLIFKTPEERESWKKDILDAQEKHTKGGPNAALGDKRIGQYVFKNSTFYRGEWLRGQVHGKGEMVQHGNTYTGNFANDLKCGLGRMVFATKEVFDGDWANDLPHGQGTMEYPSGDRYEGGWKAGQRSGHGILRYANKDVYDGNWDENYPSVRGTLTCANGLYYDGEWLHGEFHGQGVLTTATGKVYEGGWAYGQRCGRGLLRYYHNGDESLLIEEYDGEWLEDMKHGAGTHKTIEGVYTGQFVYNCREGEGSMRYSDGSTYDGGWKKDKRHGVGTFLAGSSPSRIKKYTGEWASDKKNGKGEIWFTNGNQYEGTFKKDLIHGNGTMKSFVNGAKLEGKWLQGNRMGNAKLTFKPSTNAEETRELNGACREPMLEARKMRYALAPTLPDLQFNVTL